MSRRYKAGFVTSTEPSSSGTAYTGAAAGIWLKQRQMQAVQESLWPRAPGVAGAPTNVQATGGNAQATITFNAPADNGGLTITSYTVTASPGGNTASGSSSPITITGLTNGTSYTFTVYATNAAGNGPTSSSSNSVTPASALYAFSTFTFTVAGKTGYTGPTLAECLSSYDTATYSWLNNTSYFNVTNGTQQWTCPSSGTYRITALGANGGHSYGSMSRGSGARIIADISLSVGTIYNIIVGQAGQPGGGSGGAGGGATWMFTGNVGTGSLVICAGGGGGTGHDYGNGGHGSANNYPLNGTSVSGGTNRGNGGYQGLGLGGSYSSNDGNQGSWNGPAGAGAGWGSDGTDARSGAMSGYSNIGYAGYRSGVAIYGGLKGGNVSTAGQGGFGGGGASGGNGESGGGGGGYTGGGGGANWAGGGAQNGHGGGGGGGSYWTGTLVSATAGWNSSGVASGYLIVTKLQ